MIGLDSNVVLRWLTGDDTDQDQHRAALAAVNDADADIFINAIVLAETSWVLSARYRHPRATVAAGIRQVLAHPKITVSEPAAVHAALDAYELGGAGLSDHLIGALNRAAGCQTTLTFDRIAGKGPGFVVLGAAGSET
jgi:predicted nucleic-acid-binding protein